MAPTNLFGLGFGVGPAGYGYPPGAKRPAISYPDSPFTWYDHVEVDAALPTNGGGPVTAYEVQSGTLPDGILLDATTGELTGTPTTQQVAASVVIRARGPGGISDTTISVEVLAMPLSLGSSLAAWYSADVGCYTDGAMLCVAATPSYASRAGSAALRGGATWWRCGFLYLTNTGTKRVLQSCLSGSDGYQVEVTAANVLMLTAGTGSATATATHGTALSATTWYFWYAYFDGTNIGVSLNGGAAVTQALGAAYSAGTAAFYVGCDTAPANGMNGALARNYGGDGALSAGNLTTLYAAGAGLFYANLGATLQAACGFAFNLCESSSTRVDSVGGLDLTAVNAPTVAAGPGEGLAVNNSPVKRWESRYGLLHRSQSTIAAQPLWIASGVNGRPIVRGSATSYWSNVTIPTDGVGLVTLHASKYVAGVAAYHIFYETASSTPQLRITSADKVEVDFGAGAPATSPLSYAAAWSVICAIHGRATPRICRVNGAERASNATALTVGASLNMNTWNRGGTFCLRADVHEEIFVGADVADAVVAQAESYLNSKVSAY